MKFLNFFKTTWGIIILLILAAVIILVIMNWAAITAWWNDDEAAAPGTEGSGRFSNNSQQKCVRIGRGQCSYLGLSIPCAECTRRNIQII